MATTFRPDELDLTLLDTEETRRGGTGDWLKLEALSENAPYVHVTEVAPGYVIHAHRHSESEVTVVLSGRALLGGAEYPAGSIFIVPADEEYELRAGESEPLRFVVVRPGKARYTVATEG